MSKENGDLYFPHDFNSANDEKIVAFLSLQRGEGYGIYWLIVEQMHKSDGVYFKKEYNYIATAQRTQATVERIKAILSDLVLCELFYEDEEGYYSERVIKNLEKSKRISEQNAINARKRKPKKSDRSTTASDRSTTADIQDKIKEDKTKEDKEKYKKEIPTSDEVRSLFIGYLAILNITDIDEEKLNAQIRMFIRYYIGDGEEKGKWQKQRTKFNPKSCVKNWIDKNINAYKSFANSKKEEQEPKNFSDIYTMIQEKYPNVLIGKIMNYYQWKDQLGMFDGWNIGKIYNHLLKQASYSENQKQPYKKPQKENELSKIIGDFADAKLH